MIERLGAVGAAFRHVNRPRRGKEALVVWAVLLVVSVLARDHVLQLHVIADGASRFVPLWEVLPILAATIVSGFAVSGLPDIDRLRRARLWPYLAAIGSIVVLSPVLMVLIVVAYLPSGTRWPDIVTNVLTFAALALVATASGGPALGSCLTLGAFVAIVMLQQVAPTWSAWLPVSGAEGSLEPHPWFATLSALTAVAYWTATVGGVRRQA